MTEHLRAAVTPVQATAIAVAGVAVFVGSCLLVPHGVLDAALYSDLHIYSRYGAELAAGRVPYRDFFDEYPPLAQPVFLLAHMLGGGSFALAFKALMAACGAAALVSVVATLATVRASLLRTALAAAAVAISPLLVGPLFLNAYDLWPASLTAFAVLAFVRERPRLACAALAAAVAAKVYPVALLVPALLLVERRRGRDGVRRGAISFVAVTVLVEAPFALLAPGGLGYSYWVQAKRGLELNSLGAAALLAGQRLGLWRLAIASRPPGSLNVIGPAAAAVAALSSLLVLAALVVVALAYLHGSRSSERFVLAAAAGVAGFVAFDKVFSGQYVDWLVPAVPLVGGATGLVAGSMLLPVLWLTRLVYAHRDGIQAGGGAIWLLVARDLLVVAVYAALVVRLRSRGAAA